MEMLITEAAVVVSFNQDNFIRLKQQKAEEIYKNIVAQPSLNTNQPDTADPSIPRILIKDTLKGIGISQLAARFALIFAQKEDLSKQVDAILENIDSMFNATKEFEGESNIKDTGILVSLAVPSSKPLNELNSHIFKTYSAFEPLGEVVASFYKTGFITENGLFLGIDLGTYVQPAQSGKELRSGGYTVKIDLNNKPALSNNSALTEPGALKSQFKTFIEKDMEKFFKKGLT